MNKMECFEVIYLIRAILNTIITAVGVGGNVITSIVILSKLRKNVPNILSVSLAIVNSMYLLDTSIISILRALPSSEDYSYLHQICVLLVKLNFFIAEWTLVLLCLCRYTAYIHPQHVDRIWKHFNLAVMLSVILVASCMTNFTHIKAVYNNLSKYDDSKNSTEVTSWLHQNKSMNTFNETTTIKNLQKDKAMGNKTSKQVFDDNWYSFVYYIIIIGFIPASVMLYCSIVMYRQSVSSSSVETTVSNDDPTKILMKKTNDCSRILAVLVGTFVFGLALFEVDFLCKFIGVEDNCYTIVIEHISYSLLEISASLEFYVFLMLRTDFNATVLEMLSCEK